MKGFLWAFILLVGVYAAYSILRITQNTAPDFSVYYGVAKNALSGGAIYGDPHLFTGYGYPPFSILAYLPFALLPYRLSQALWVIGSFMALIASVFLSFRIYSPKTSLQTKILACSLAFLAFPTRFTLGMGQSNLMVLLLLLLGFRSGILMGVSWIIKPQLMLFALLLAWKREWRTLVVASLTLGVAVATSGIFFGWHWYGQYFARELPILMEFRGREIYYNQGIEAFLSRHSLGQEVAQVSKIILTVIAIWVTRKRKILEALLIWISLLLLIMPLAWQHHFVFLIPAFVYLFSRQKNKMLFWTAAVLVGINFADPDPIVLSHVFFGNILVFILLALKK